MDFLSLVSSIPPIAFIVLLVVVGIIVFEVVMLLRKKNGGNGSVTPIESFGSTPQNLGDVGHPQTAAFSSSPTPTGGPTPGAQLTPAAPNPQTTVEPPKPRKSRKNTVLAGIALFMLVAAVPVTVFVVRQNQELRSRAFTEQKLPTSLLDQDTNAPSLLINTDNYTEPDRTDPTLIFANAVVVNPATESLQLVVKNTATGATVATDIITSRIVIEKVVAAGKHTITLTNTKNNEKYYDSEIDIKPETAVILIRTKDTTAIGRYVATETPYANFPSVRFYNLSNDNNLNLFGGTLKYYDVLTQVQTDSYRNLEFSTYEYVSFSMSSALNSLHRRLLTVKNTRRMKMIFFAFGDESYAYVSGTFIPFAEAFKAPQSQPATDATPQWCEGTYTCTALGGGKSCLPTPDLCVKGSSGGSGLKWNGQKTIIPDTKKQ